MKPDSWPRIKEILSRAFDLPAEQRQAFIGTACEGDADLRREVEGFLSAGEAEHGDSELPSAVTQLPVSGPLFNGVGSRIGRYRVKRLIGSGGMGAVYEAVQEQPRRTVALKVMKRGITSRTALRRFEYEAQLLARLRHPGIAQVFEAGTHDDGAGPVPFFALEYIPGARSLTDHAVEKSLTVRQQLELFTLVCDAVHHGHQKGIIHRDLKPANILVDALGQPKIIDFGVARATDSDLAVTTLQTDVGQLIGTLQYMSPEQCDADPHDIDTRSDVYTLGVVLYELLCRRAPYKMEGNSVIEAATVVRDQAPTRPSSVNRLLRGDIETIVLKALEKDRDRRYRSAAQLADDIHRYLRAEPINARPPSVTYQARMFARRHRVLVGAAAIIAAVIALAIVGIGWGLVEAKAARARAQAEADNARAISSFLRDILILPNPALSQSHAYTVEEALDIASGRVSSGLAGSPDVETDIRSIIGATYRSLGNYDAAEAHLQAALNLRVKHYGDTDPTALSIMSQLAGVNTSRGKGDEAIAILRKVLDLQERSVGKNDPATLKTVSELAWSVYRRHDVEECERLFRRLLEGNRVAFGPQSAPTIKAMSTLAMPLIDLKRFDEAEPLANGAVERGRTVFGERHPDYLYALNVRAWLLRHQGKLPESIEQYKSLTAMADQVMGVEHPYNLYWKSGMAWTMMLAGKASEAEPIFRQNLDIQRRRLGADHPETIDAQVGLARSLLEQGKESEAEPMLLNALTRAQGQGAQGRSMVSESAVALVKLYERQGKPDQAAKYRPLIQTDPAD
jgi:tetratricopeptide (TPR) repeat protein/tRNA A-37 threonylcarbamoyl transferase component Bud32